MTLSFAPNAQHHTHMKYLMVIILVFFEQLDDENYDIMINKMVLLTTQQDAIIKLKWIEL